MSFLILFSGCASASSSRSGSALPAGTPSSAAISASTSPPPSSAVAASAPSPSGLSQSSADWPVYHRDPTHTGYVPDLPDPQKLAVAWNVPLDGAVYAEPLFVKGHVIVATEGDSVYSLDGQTGKVIWHTNVGAPVPRSSLPCGDIDPLGITGTPVYDPASGLVFVVAEVTGPSHLLFGLSADTGEVRVKRAIDPPGTEPNVHQQRAGLALLNGTVYVAFGGLFGDCGNYHGMVVGFKTDGSGPLLTFQVPTGREGGIWATPGPAVDAAGRLFVSVGNGSEAIGNWDKSDSVLRLSPTLTLEDGFAPDQWRQDNLTDADLGSLGPILLPGDLVLIAGKAGIAYTLSSDKLGGIGGQLQSKSLCHAYGGAAVVGSVAYVPCDEGVQQVTVGIGGSLQAGWRADGIAGSPVVGGKTLYSLDRNGKLHALDVQTGKERASLEVGSVTRFATPTLGGGFIYVGTMSGITAVTGS